MTAVHRTAVVTVKEPVGQPMFRRRPRWVDAELRASEHETVKPHPLVWKKAKELAGGDVSRLQVEPDGSVIVLNRSKYDRSKR